MLEPAGTPSHSACESSFLVPEQLALYEAIGKSCTVDGNKRSGSPRAQLVDRCRHPLLSGTALACDQHGSGRWSHLLDERKNVQHGLGYPDQTLEYSVTA